MSANLAIDQQITIKMCSSVALVASVARVISTFLYKNGQILLHYSKISVEYICCNCSMSDIYTATVGRSDIYIVMYRCCICCIYLLHV